MIVEKVKLELVYHDPTIYPRKRGVDPRRVERYAACMRDGDNFDIIEVEPVDGKYRLLDGLHRLKAMQEIGIDEADVRIVNLAGKNPLLYAARQNRFGKDLTDDDAADVARRVFQETPTVTNREIALAIGRSETAVSGYLSDLRARHEQAQDLKIFKMGLLGIPQERIAQRLGITQFVVHDHLLKTSELKNAINELVTKGFAINTIAEKLSWAIGTINTDLAKFSKNGENAENAKPDPLRIKKSAELSLPNWCCKSLIIAR